MKEWMCWVLLVVSVGLICWFGWWLTTIFDTLTIYYITVGLNGLVFWGLKYQANK